MTQVLLCLIMFAGAASAQAPAKAQADKFKKDAAGVERAIDEAIDSTVPGLGRLQEAKGTYLEGYGAVFTAQLMLEPTRNPFSGVRSPAEVRTIVTQRRKEIQGKLVSLLQDRAGSMEAVAPTEWVTFILYLINSNPADTPDLPSQIVISVKKQDVLDFRDGKIPNLSTRINVREY